MTWLMLCDTCNQPIPDDLEPIEETLENSRTLHHHPHCVEPE